MPTTIRPERSPHLEVFLPGEAGYDTYRQAWNTAVEHRPQMVAVPDSVEGVREMVDFARGQNLSIAIQATGHGPIRPVIDAVLINLSRLNRVTLDLERQRARVEGGAKWGAVLEVVTHHGLAPLLGSTPDVGAVGYTLGGGLGWLARKYGTAADSVHSFEIVTADGRLVRAAPDDNPDLFWALRGGGAGHLGVVTAMEIQLYPIAQVYAGNLFYPAELAVEVMTRWRDWLASVPDDLTSAVEFVNFPVDPSVPPEFAGKSYVMVRGAFDGPSEQGEELLSYWRDWKAPEIDLFGPLPFERIAEVSDDPLEPFPNDGTGLWLRSLSDGAIEELATSLFSADPILLLVEIRHAGGALARGSQDVSAYGNRDANLLLEFVAYTPEGQWIPEVRAEIERIRGVIASDLTGGVYLNYVEGDQRRIQVEAGLGGSAYRRLAAVKARFDPTDRFDHGLDVTTKAPSPGVGAG